MRGYFLGVCRWSLLCGLLLYLSIIDLSARIVDEPMSAGSSLGDTGGLKRLYDLVLQNMDTPLEWVYLDSLESEAVREKNIKYQGLIYRNRVRYYYNKTNFDSAVYYANLSIPFFKRNNQRKYLTDVESMIVNLHTWRNEYEFALMKGNEMFNESERMGDRLGMISACENIGFALVNSYRERDALDWYRKSLSLLKEEKDQEIYEIQMELLIIDCFHALDEVDSMKVHLGLMYDLLTSFEGKRDQLENGKLRIAEYWVWYYAQLAEASIKEKSYGIARVYLEKADQYVAQGVEPMSMEVYYWACSNYYQAIGDYGKALEAERKSSEYSLVYEDDTPEQLYRFAFIYGSLRDFRQSISLYQKGLALSDSIKNKLFSTQISQFNSIYEVNELTEEGKHQRMTVGLLSVVLVSLLAFALLLGIYIFIFLQYKKRLSEATRKAKEADLNTTIFLDNVSREIRTALDTISGLSRDLINEPAVEEKRRYSELVRGKNEILQRVIFNILDVSKIESDRMVFDYTSVNPSDMMDEIKGWASRLLTSGRSIHLLCPSDVCLKSDLSRLRQILKNLLYYSISHSSSGDIKLECRSKEKEVEFVVSCEGLILNDDERHLLFDRQVQAGKSLEDMGLELVICKELVTKMGGVLSMSDRKQVGASFTFTLPIETN